MGVACGGRHTMVWLGDGHVYAFGNNFYAQLGYNFQQSNYKQNKVSCWLQYLLLIIIIIIVVTFVNIIIIIISSSIVVLVTFVIIIIIIILYLSIYLFIYYIYIYISSFFFQRSWN